MALAISRGRDAFVTHFGEVLETRVSHPAGATKEIFRTMLRVVAVVCILSTMNAAFEITSLRALSQIMGVGKWRPDRAVGSVPWKLQGKELPGAKRHPLPPWMRIGRKRYRIALERATDEHKHRVVVAAMPFVLRLRTVPYSREGNEIFLVTVAKMQILPESPDAPVMLARSRDALVSGLDAYRKRIEDHYSTQILRAFQPGM